MTDQVIAITADEFETFITQPQHQDRRFELIYGEIIEKHMPTEEHGVIPAVPTPTLTASLTLTPTQTLTFISRSPRSLLWCQSICR